MEYNLEQGKELIELLTDLWLECSRRCDRIEQLIKQINEEKKQDARLAP